MKVGPSQRIRAKQAAKARPLSASEATSGSPSPWNVFARTATQASESEARLSVSVRESDEEEVIVGGGDRRS